MEDRRRRSLVLRTTFAALLIAGAVLPSRSDAQCNHGVSVFKTCESPKRTCTSNADCNDQNECTDDVCDTVGLSNLTNCVLTLAHADTCGDRTKVTEAFDTQDVGGDNVRVPAVGNLPIDAINGNAVCCAGPALPCFVAPAGDAGVIANSATGCGNLALPGAAIAGSVLFRQNTYVIQANDPNPLPDQGTFRVQDLCNAGAPGCSMVSNILQFTAATDLVTGCDNPFAQDSTPCTDNDNDLCTTAGCTIQGVCDQNHIVTTCPLEDCNLGQCDPQTGLCVPVPDSNPCPDTDQNPCTLAGCQAGICDQNHVSTPDSTPCPDDDGTLCTIAGCDGFGTCDQNHQQVICGNPTCQTCEPQSGQCVPEQPVPPECDLNHFQCYEVDRPFPEPFAIIPGVTLNDRYGPGTVDVKRPKRLCAPADKQGEDPGADADPDHLAGYEIKQRTPRFEKVFNQQVTNQFGSITLTVIKPDRLLVPTSKSLTGTPPTPTAPLFGHFKCYRVRGAKFRSAGISVEDQFGVLTEDIKKPFRLCAPADKNSEGTVATPDLLCYKVRESAGTPRFQAPGTLYLNNQFGAHTYGLTGLRELCVPSTVTQGP